MQAESDAHAEAARLRRDVGGGVYERWPCGACGVPVVVLSVVCVMCELYVLTCEV